jgi:GH25 family lysozyme M1 (1,4-beta-N-acetylmuramidase)
MEPKKRKGRVLTLVLAVTALLLAAVTAGFAIYCIPFYGTGDDPAPIATDPPEPPPTPAPTEEPEPTLPPPEPNPYGQLDFQYNRNNYLKLLEGESITGIDVSRYQYEIDFEAVKASGVDFVIIRLAYRGYESGKIVFDKYAHSNLEKAAEAGLDIGVYFFSQAITPEEAEEEAYFVLEAIQDYDLSMPIVFDWESVSDPNARTADMDKETLTKCCKAFLDTIQAAGEWPMLYLNRRQAKYHMDIAQLKDYDFWLAAYTDRMDFPYKIKMWQYTNKGSVPGVVGECDVNIYFPDL